MLTAATVGDLVECNGKQGTVIAQMIATREVRARRGKTWVPRWRQGDLVFKIDWTVEVRLDAARRCRHLVDWVAASKVTKIGEVQ